MAENKHRTGGLIHLLQSAGNNLLYALALLRYSSSKLRQSIWPGNAAEDGQPRAYEWLSLH